MTTGEGDDTAADRTGGVARRPAVWPVFVAFVVALVAITLLTAAILHAVRLTRSSTILLVAALVSSATLVTVALVAAAPWNAGAAGRLGLTPSRLPWRRVPVVCLGLLGLSQAIDSATTLLGLGALGAVDEMTQIVASASRSFAVSGVLVIGLGAGTAEEIFFRGLVQTRLVARWGLGIGLGTASLLFGLAHLDAFLTPAALLVGLYLGWVRQRAGSVWPAAAAHAVNNTAWVLLACVGTLTPATHVALLLFGLLLATGAFAWEETYAARG